MASSNALTPAKRSRSDLETENVAVPAPADSKDEDVSSSEEEDIGPALPSAASAPAKKKRRILPHESLYLAALPRSARYSKSLMHKAVLSFVVFTPATGWLITCGVDGQVSFWKKGVTQGDVEFVKEFKAHQGEIKSVSVSRDGKSFASSGADETIKVWDVVTFDLVAVITPLEKKPGCICWVGGRGVSALNLAVGNEVDGEIAIWDGRGERTEPIHTIKTTHKKPVVAMAYNPRYDCVVSADNGGMVEYWRPGENYRKLEGLFKMKSETSLFEFKKAKSIPTSITVSPSGHQFATFSLPDRQVRLFDFSTARLHRTYDESIETITTMQQAGTAITALDPVEFGRRLAVERELDAKLEVNPTSLSSRAYTNNVIFDESGNFLLYGSLYGVKVVNTTTNKIVRVFGKDEPFRSVHLALYQGQPERKGVVTVEMAASENPLLKEAEARDAVLVATGANKVRFYLFTDEESIEKSTRDIQNEKPINLAAKSGTTAEKAVESSTSATLHTTYGDINLRLFPSASPLAVENFVSLSRAGAYNNCIFHRVIRKFMIQTGDYEFGDGTGGKSIWGKEFEDEFGGGLKFDRPYTVAMANAGAGTNGSQFFVTTEKTPWLDGKHTIFGRVVGGLDVVHKIENARVYKEKPEEDIRIVNVSVS